MSPTITSCLFCGADVNFVKILDGNRGREPGVQYHFNVSPLQVEKLLQKPSFGIMRKFDMFSMLKTLLVRLLGMLEEPWVRSTLFFKNFTYAVFIWNF